MENENNKNISNEELQKQLQEALEAQKKLQEQIDQLKKDSQPEPEENKDLTDEEVDEYVKQKAERKAEIKKNKTFGEKMKEYSFTIVFLLLICLAPIVIIKGKAWVEARQAQRFAEKVENRNNLTGDWTSEDGSELHIDKEGNVYYVTFEGKAISKIMKGVIHVDMVCVQNTCTEKEGETYESGGVDFKSEYVNEGSDSYTDYKDVPEKSYISTKYIYEDFKNKSATTVSIYGKNFTK